MASKYVSENGELKVKVEPGICGLECLITVRIADEYIAEIKSLESSCKKLQSLSEHLNTIDLTQVLAPIDKHPVYTASTRAGLHPSCPVPTAVIKACEVVLGLAVPKDVHINLEK